jgi:hypothetical protein
LAFQEELNTFGCFCWTGKAFAKKVIFLDLDTTLGNGGGFPIKTYQEGA